MNFSFIYTFSVILKEQNVKYFCVKNMIIWILNSESGVKLLYKSFLKTDADEDIVSGFLSAFYHFSMVEFHESLESIEMGGLRWSYILEPKFNLL